MILYVVGAVVAWMFLTKKSAGSVSPGGISNGQTYAQDPSTATSVGATFDTGAAPFTVPGNVPVLPTGSPGTNLQAVSAQAAASFSGINEARSGIGHFSGGTYAPTTGTRTGRGAF